MVARPGTGTTSEAIVSGCPLLLNCLGGVMPQEQITVKFCRKHRLAELIRSPEELARIVEQWRERPELPATIRLAMKTACPPHHPRDIVRTIAALKKDGWKIFAVEQSKKSSPYFKLKVESKKSKDKLRNF